MGEIKIPLSRIMRQMILEKLQNVFVKFVGNFSLQRKKSADLKGRVQGQVDKYIEVNFFYF